MVFGLWGYSGIVFGLLGEAQVRSSETRGNGRALEFRETLTVGEVIRTQPDAVAEILLGKVTVLV